MNSFLKSISKLCGEYRLEEKILVARTFSEGHQIIEALAKGGLPCVNLRVGTLRSLAQEAAGIELAGKKVKTLTDKAINSIIEDIYIELESRPGSYFKGLEAKDGIVSAVAGALMDLRMCGMRAKDIDAGRFLNAKKGLELKELAKKYEEFLKKNSYADYAETIRTAIGCLAEEKKACAERLFLLPSDMPVTPLEKEFIEVLQGKTFILPHDRPFGIKMPEGLLKASDHAPSGEGSDIGGLPWLFDTERAPKPFKDSTINIFHSLGRRNEIREVIRRITASEAKNDEVEIIHTHYDSYVPLIHSIAQKLDLEVTFAEGVQASFTRPGRAVLGFLSWISSDYDAVIFRRLITSGDVSLKAVSPDEEISSSLMGRLVREAKIGWGRDRYISCLNKLLKADSDKVAAEEDEGRIAYLRKREKNLGLLIREVDRILSSLPEEKEEIELKTITQAATDFISRFAIVLDERSAGAKKAVIEALKDLDFMGSKKLPFGEALKRVEDTIADLRVGHSGPAPGAIHVSSYMGAGRSGRAYKYFVGCEAVLFPGSQTQDPVLLDEERTRLNDGLKTSPWRLKEKLYRMAALLASLKNGILTLSFSSYDVVEDRDSFPSSLVLQAHRLVSGDPEADYTALMGALGAPRGYRQVKGALRLDTADFWINNVATDSGMRNAGNSVAACYEGLKEGQKALNGRKSEVYTVYDGVTGPHPELDPRVNKALVFSPSRLEALAKCPFSFFLRHVLGVYPLEELTKTPGQWLDNADRGNLLHELFCEFMNEIKEKGERPSLATHKVPLKKKTEAIIARYKDEIPPASEAAFEQEKSRIIKASEIFLRIEEELAKSSTPEFFESSFGKNDGAAAGLDLQEPVDIQAGKDTFRLAGRIDKISKLGEGGYGVWDYKTGSASPYKGGAVFNGGRELQPALYTLAAEKMLRKKIDKNAKVLESGYLFPTEKGGGKVVRRTRDDQGLSELLKDLLDMIKNGAFIYTDDEGDCAYCDYNGVCAEPEINGKFKNSGNKEPELLKKIRDRK